MEEEDCLVDCKIRDAEIKVLDCRAKTYAELWVKTGNTFDAYIEAYKRIVAVKASQKLGDPKILEYIIELTLKERNPTIQQKLIQQESERCGGDLMNRYWNLTQRTIRKGENPITNLKEAYMLLSFFRVFFFGRDKQSKKYADKLKKVVNACNRRLEFLSRKNPIHWKRELSKMQRELKAININPQSFQE